MDASEKLINQIQERVTENRISCKEALEIADENRISRHEMGKLLNKLKIKIRQCQLGCF
jgi:LAO/AO transport system kinase